MSKRTVKQIILEFSFKINYFLNVSNSFHNETLVRFILTIFTLALMTSVYEFFKYNEILNKESVNSGYYSNATFNILKDEMTFSNDYTLINESCNQLIFLSSPNILLNTYFILIQNYLLTG